MWYFGSDSPAIRYSPDENCETIKHTLKNKKTVHKSGAAAAVGFIILKAAAFGHLNPIKARAGLLLQQVTEALLKEFSKMTIKS